MSWRGALCHNVALRLSSPQQQQHGLPLPQQLSGKRNFPEPFLPVYPSFSLVFTEHVLGINLGLYLEISTITLIFMEDEATVRWG